MRIVNTKKIENCVYRLARKAGTSLTPACRAAMENAAERETSPACKFALDTLLDNARLAEKEELPVCQDTGMACVLIRLGQQVALTGDLLEDAVNRGVRRAYADGYFRKSVCDPITRINTGDNTPAAIHLEIVAGDKIEITFLPKGFGSENMSRLYMLTPAKGTQGVVDCIVQTVKEAGSRPCPPVCIGVGLGGNFDGCAFLAKKALTREIGSHNPREDVRAIEEEALRRINELGIGCQGFGGNVTALNVACEIAPTHIAGLPVAVNVQCHCVRCEKEVL